MAQVARICADCGCCVTLRAGKDSGPFCARAMCCPVIERAAMLSLADRAGLAVVPGERGRSRARADSVGAAPRGGLGLLSSRGDGAGLWSAEALLVACWRVTKNQLIELA